MPVPRPKKSVKTLKAPDCPKSVKKTKASAALCGTPMKRVEVVYKGRVQGVGFRFNAEKVALESGVTGWVRNEHNGDVHLVAQGTEEQLLGMLEGIRKCPVGRHITREKIVWGPCCDAFNDFRIEYHF